MTWCLTDPKYEEEVSGCTACVGFIAGKKLYVVCLLLLSALCVAGQICHHTETCARILTVGKGQCG